MGDIPMTGEAYPKDENLRLILSADQDKWIRQHIKNAKTFAWSMAVLIALSGAWLAADFSSVFSQYDDPECFSFIGEAANNQELRKEYLAKGMKPCPPENSEDSSISWTDIRTYVTAISLILIIVSTLNLFRQVFLLRKFQGYLTDHRAFLEKYGRL